MEKVPDLVGGQTVEQVAQSGCGASICGDIQNPAGLAPGRRAVWTMLERMYGVLY